MATRTDKRVLQTKESIKTAFMQLMLDSDLEKITISQITQKASINRSTFYLHYRDVKTIIEEIDEEFAQVISRSIDEFDLNDVYGSIYSMFSNISSSLANKDITRAYIIYSSDAANIAERLKKTIVEKAMEAMLRAYPSLHQSDMIYPLTFAAAGIVDCYIKWVKDENSGKSLDTLIRGISLYTEYILTKITEL